jgi:primosomal protein N' (replication factor Y)
VSVPVRGTFSYAVPNGLAPLARVGCRAMVPFKNRTVTGYILEKIPRDNDQNLKEILDILDTEPLFHDKLTHLFKWMADYYVHPIGQVIQSVLPGGLNMNPFKTASLTEKGLAVLDMLPPLCEEKKILSWINDHPEKRLAWPLPKITRLQKKGWLVVQERMKKRRGGPLMRRFVRPKDGIDLQSLIEETGSSLKAQGEIEFLEAVFGSNGILLSELSAAFANGAYLAEKWVKKGVLERYTGAVYRGPAGNIMFPSPLPFKLYEQQQRALSHILRFLDKGAFCSCLLYGITGSGKTEVYYRAVEHAIGLDRQAILLVPEISLAVYLEGVFRSRLGDRIAIYHSGLSPGERYDQWMRMARGEVDLVIGARSALFAPLSRLGLIIVDEEHDSSYKQEGSPRYQARDMAVVRAKMEKALVILGSGTPSIQSFQNSIRHRYQLILMRERIEKRPLPDVEVVDMKTLEDSRPKNEMVSPRLREALDQNLAEGNQTILFLNRRGFHRLYLCKSCGQSIQCPNCDVALTYHLKEDQLLCHYCGFYSGTRAKCTSCGCEGLRAYGFGTEKLERELKEMFPDARVARMDTDSTRKKGQSFAILRSFGRHEVDILVGTQMITKGYDFPGVTLVGVIAADLSLGFPDFRAGERTFQILSQVAGRAGRGNRRGRVIIQTFNPDHYSISTAMAHDYQSFFEKERDLREQLGYPPFSHLACLRVQGNNKRETEETAHSLGQGIQGILKRWPKRGKEIQVLGPVAPALSKLHGKYRWQILIKSRSVSLLRHLLAEIEIFAKKDLRSRGTQLILDVDPYQMS